MSLKLVKVSSHNIFEHEDKRYYKFQLSLDLQEKIESYGLIMDKDSIWVEMPDAFRWIYKATVDIVVDLLPNQMPKIVNVLSYYLSCNCGEMKKSGEKCECEI